MKTARRPVFFTALFLGSLLLAAAACGADRFIVIGTTTAPSTSGFVEIVKARDDGGTILVRMEQLHPVDRIDPSAKYYVVWLQASDSSGAHGAPLLAGPLRYNPDARSGELRTNAPFPKFIVKITAETTDKPATPSEIEVASQAVSVND